MANRIRVLHVLANSTPDLNGYAIRTHDLLISQKNAEICEPIGLTSPFYPEREAMQEPANIDGITYLRCAAKKPVKSVPMKKPSKPSTGKMIPTFKRIFRPLKRRLKMPMRFIGEKREMRRFGKHINQVVQENNISLIHAHTPFRVALPALRAARKRGIPFIYEMRGMWEESAVAMGRWTTKSLPYKYYRKQENKVIKSADHIVAIGEQLRLEAIRRGVSESNITMIPNAIGLQFEQDTRGDKPESLTSLKKRMNLTEGSLVVGYIGSIRKMEGVELTVDAVSILASQGLDVRFLSCSSVANQDQIRERCNSKGIEEISFIEGPFPHEEIQWFYRLIDIFVVSRPDTVVTRIVPPIKPLEAMAMEIPTIVSNLPALQDIIEDGKTGRTFKAGDANSLAEVIAELASDPEVSAELSTRGRNKVLTERTWSKVVEGYRAPYNQLINGVKR